VEVLRALALAAEAPSPALERAASALELGPLPTAVEYTDLFEFQLYPYASVYLGGEGMMGGEARDRIAGFWRALGESPPTEPDHLTVLLAAHAELVDRETEARDEATAAHWRHARSAFLWEHLLSWLPVYLDKVSEIGPDFYRRWAALLSRLLAEELAVLAVPQVLPLHLREAPPLGNLGDADGDEFLKAVTTPVRTGMIVVRSDLERCARALGLGLRKGERRFALKSLVGQAPRETLEWLTGEADRWAERHAERTMAPPLVSEFWQERAAAAAVFLRESAVDLGTGTIEQPVEKA
jgi:TorA maturation chaperone TorD